MTTIAARAGMSDIDSASFFGTRAKTTTKNMQVAIHAATHNQSAPPLNGVAISLTTTPEKRTRTTRHHITNINRSPIRMGDIVAKCIDVSLYAADWRDHFRAKTDACSRVSRYRLVRAMRELSICV